jgi:hypothetical protein
VLTKVLHTYFTLTTTQVYHINWSGTASLVWQLAVCLGAPPHWSTPAASGNGNRCSLMDSWPHSRFYEPRKVADGDWPDLQAEVKNSQSQTEQRLSFHQRSAHKGLIRTSGNQDYKTNQLVSEFLLYWIWISENFTVFLKLYITKFDSEEFFFFQILYFYLYFQYIHKCWQLNTDMR